MARTAILSLMSATQAATAVPPAQPEAAAAAGQGRRRALASMDQTGPSRQVAQAVQTAMHTHPVALAATRQ